MAFFYEKFNDRGISIENYQTFSLISNKREKICFATIIKVPNLLPIRRMLI